MGVLVAVTPTWLRGRPVRGTGNGDDLFAVRMGNCDSKVYSAALVGGRSRGGRSETPTTLVFKEGR